MPFDWTATTLGELCDRGIAFIQTGPFGSQLHASDYCSTGVPVIPTEAIGRRSIRGIPLPRISEEKAQQLARHRLQAGDILFARRGVQATGLSALVTQDFEGALCGTGAILLRVRGSDINPAYLSFHLSSDKVISWLKAHAVGAVMPNLNEGMLRNLPLYLPPLIEQQAIATLLGSIDDKINLNRRLNQTLETMSQELFRSWFVDFDPVRAQAEGCEPASIDVNVANLFPSRLASSELGEIPEGWCVGSIGDFASIERAQVEPSEIPPETPYIGLEHMPRGSICLDTWERVQKVTSGKLTFHRGQILFGRLRPYFKKVGVALTDGVCSSDILVIQPREQHFFGWLTCQISRQEFIDYTSQVSSGTRMPRVSWDDVARYKVAMPRSDQLARAFDAFIRPLIARMQISAMESRTLASLRDTLLPKLLSGEIRLKDVETTVGAAV